MDHETGRCKGFCHIEFDAPESAKKAIQLNGQELDGRPVKLDLSEPKRNGGGGRGGGDRGFRGGGGFRGGDRGFGGGGFRGGDRGFGGGFRGGDRGGFRGGDRGGFRGGDRGGSRGRGFPPSGVIAANKGNIVGFSGSKKML